MTKLWWWQWWVHTAPPYAEALGNVWSTKLRIYTSSAKRCYIRHLRKVSKTQKTTCTREKSSVYLNTHTHAHIQHAVSYHTLRDSSSVAAANSSSALPTAFSQPSRSLARADPKNSTEAVRSYHAFNKKTKKKWWVSRRTM